MAEPAPDRRRPSVSVVVVNWNSGGALARLLDSLERHPPTTPLEIIVVDNHSSDTSAALADRDNRRVLRLTGNVGLAAGNNAGITSSAAPYVLICNPDVELPAGAVDHLVATLERHPTAAWVVPRLVGPDGRPQTSAGDLPTLTEALVGRRASRLLARARRPATAPDGRSGFWWHDWAHDEETAVGHGAEACYLVRRRAIEEIGLQDEHFRLDWEGVEWSARAATAGWEVRFDPGVTVVHAGGTSVRQVPYRWVVQSHRGMYRYFAGRTAPVVRPLLALAVALRAAAKLLGVASGRPLYQRAHSVARSEPDHDTTSRAGS